ncbi:Universal stress protein A-like protein [Sesamum angolense]|uniref:Universal stress protein A-like protein n=1 Tax=Sesamum angolense TaxID=2727404 RepID=A0AAE1WGR1_9LAMI|nr:Universal stress protein A-like protein [Sesamum angolense]
MAAESADPTRILVAVNQSTIKGYPHASISRSGAFEWTVKKIIRSNTSGFKLLFLHVQVPDEDGFDDMDSIYASPADFMIMKHRDRIKDSSFGVAGEAWVKKGDPKEIICHEVKRVQPDFLVLGSRGLGPFQKVFVGTVSEFCAKHADCPVIAIKRNVAETPQDPVED